MRITPLGLTLASPRSLLIAALFLALCPVLLSQQVPKNDSIVKATNMGFSEDAIVAYIGHSQETFDTSADGLVALKNAGVSSKVISAMEAKNPVLAPTPTTQNPAGPESAASIQQSTATLPQALTSAIASWGMQDGACGGGDSRACEARDKIQLYLEFEGWCPPRHGGEWHICQTLQPTSPAVQDQPVIPEPAPVADDRAQVKVPEATTVEIGPNTDDPAPEKSALRQMNDEGVPVRGILATIGTLGLGLLIAGILFIFLPVIVASSRGHRNTFAIFLVVLFLGWTGIGWIVALVWAFSNPPQVIVLAK